LIAVKKYRFYLLSAKCWSDLIQLNEALWYVSENTMIYHIQYFTFSTVLCSMGVKDHRRGPNIWFYQTGIGGADDQISSQGWRLRTLQTIIDELGDTDVRHLILLADFSAQFSEEKQCNNNN
jgi:hypothetical protein